MATNNRDFKVKNNLIVEAGQVTLGSGPLAYNSNTSKLQIQVNGQWIDISDSNDMSFMDVDLAIDYNGAPIYSVGGEGVITEATKMVDGGTMTGTLVLASDPINNLEAATKQYVDSAQSSAQSAAETTAQNALDDVLDGTTDFTAIDVNLVSRQIAATTGNINLSNPGTAVFDGHTLVTGDRLLVWQQSTQSQNGIYVFDTSSTALTRASDSDAWDELVGTLVYVDQGTSYGEARFFCTANTGGTLGSTAVTYVQDGSGTLSTSNFVTEETPSGSINGSNTAFTLANTPTSGTVKLYLNGVRLKSGSGNDYTISTNTITMTTAPINGDVLLADYMK